MSQTSKIWNFPCGEGPLFYDNGVVSWVGAKFPVQYVPLKYW